MSRLPTTTPDLDERKDLTLEALYRRYSGWLVARLRRRFDPGLAEDLAQETYLRVARIEPTDIRHPKALLMQVAVNVGRDQARRSAVRAPVAGSAHDAIATALEIPTPADQAEALLFKQVILALPPLYRDVFLLNRFKGLTYEQIAEHLGVAVITVERRMAKALALCAAQLRE